MKNLPLISVIIPVYNVNMYLDQCIDSVVKQQYKNLEIILVDDGSNDGSEEKCDKWARLDPRIKVIHKKNQGLGFARNSGLEIVQGKYVTFVDSDDVITESMIKKLIDGIRINDSDVCIGGYSRIDENNNVLFKKVNSKQFYKDSAVKNKLLPRLIGGLPDKHDSLKMSVWNVMFSMDIIKKYSLRFVSERKYMSEDILWDIEYFIRANRAQIIDSSEYLYRTRSGSLTTQVSYDKCRLQKVEKLYKREYDLIRKYNIKGDAKVRLQKVFFINLRSCFIQDIKFKRGIKKYYSVKKLVEDPVVIGICHEYPITKLDFRQRVFTMLIKRKRVLQLIFLLEVMY